MATAGLHEQSLTNTWQYWTSKPNLWNSEALIKHPRPLSYATRHGCGFSCCVRGSVKSLPVKIIVAEAKTEENWQDEVHSLLSSLARRVRESWMVFRMGSDQRRWFPSAAGTFVFSFCLNLILTQSPCVFLCVWGPDPFLSKQWPHCSRCSCQWRTWTFTVRCRGAIYTHNPLEHE